MHVTGDRVAVAGVDFFDGVLIVHIRDDFSLSLIGERQDDHGSAIDRLFGDYRIIGKSRADQSMRRDRQFMSAAAGLMRARRHVRPGFIPCEVFPHQRDCSLIAFERLSAQNPELGHAMLVDLGRILALRLRMASAVIADLRGA